MSRRRGTTDVAVPTRGPRILLAEPDPYLAFLIRVDVPDAEVVEADPDEPIAGALHPPPDAIIVDLDGVRAPELLATRGSSPIVGIVDGRQAARTAPPPALEHLLLRPFRPGELYRALRESLGLPAEGSSAPPSPLERVKGWLRVARLAAVAVGAGADAAMQAFRPGPVRSAAIAGALAVAVVRLAVRRESRRWSWIDTAFAMVLLAGTGGVHSPFLPAGFVVSAEAGLVLGMRTGALAGVALSAGSVAPGIASLVADASAAGQLFSWFALFPLVAVTGGLAARMWLLDGRDATPVLLEANRALGTLHRLARSVPGGLDVGGVAEVALEQARDVLGAPAGVLLVGEAELLGTAGSYGLAPHARPCVDRAAPRLARLLRARTAVVRLGDLPESLAAELGDHGCWLAAPLRFGGSVLGMVLVACPSHAEHDLNGLVIRRLADETALAVENARIFDNVRRLSVDSERRRLARELHDGVAQALTHVRLELDFLARHGAASPDEIRGEAGRLARVVERAVDEVRSTIVGLRSRTNGEGLAAALRSYLNDLRGLGGPEITYLASGKVHLPPDAEQEAFRIAQEAVSNSLRHSKAGRVRVCLDADAGGLRLEVDDDGVGLGDGVRQGGMGLRAMRERARSIGAQLVVGAREGGGTRVQLCLRNAGRTLDPSSVQEETA